MTRGRKPLPRETLALRDTLRKDRDRPSSVIGEPIKPEDVPQRCQVSGLQGATDRARKIYWSTCRKVAAQGLLDPAFCQELLIYSVELDLLIKCEEDIRKNGMYLIVETKKGTMAIANPAVKQLHQAADRVLKIGSNFGFDPVSRSRLKAAALFENEPKKTGIKALFAAVIEESDEGVDEQ